MTSGYAEPEGIWAPSAQKIPLLSYKPGGLGIYHCLLEKTSLLMAFILAFY